MFGCQSRINARLCQSFLKKILIINIQWSVIWKFTFLFVTINFFTDVCCPQFKVPWRTVLLDVIIIVIIMELSQLFVVLYFTGDHCDKIDIEIAGTETELKACNIISKLRNDMYKFWSIFCWSHYWTRDFYLRRK